MSELSFFKKEHSVYKDEKSNSLKEALEQTTHLGIGAHQDDLEVMASHGILNCLGKKDLWFSGVTCTNGAGSARSGKYKSLSDAEMVKVRSEEQVASAKIGEYSSMIQLGYESGEVKKESNPMLIDDLKKIITQSCPAFIYSHNLADKHDTHIAVVMATITALRELDYKPHYFYGCEVWRTLDWLGDHRKVPLEISEDTSLVSQMIECHHSQIEGGKRYDLAALGRMKSNATFFESHSVDNAQNLWFAMDLKPLLEDKSLNPSEFVSKYIDEFKKDVCEKVNRFI